MPIKRFEAVLPGKGMVDCYYKYDSEDRVYSVSVPIEGLPADPLFDHELYASLLEKAIEHHQQVKDARHNKAGNKDSNALVP
jgi:hypothetical protein